MDRLEYTFRDGTTTHDVIEWARKFEEYDYRRIAEDTFTDESGEWRVSTIWLGMPSMFGATRVFETAIFHNGNWEAEAHWVTEEQATEGHATIVSAVMSGELDKVPGLER